MRPPEGIFIDHANMDGLDNRRANLRLATKGQNEANTPKRKNNTSGFKGVFWDKTKNSWLAQAHLKSGSKYLGRYKDKNAAAQAYDSFAKKQWGEFAQLNFPEKK